MSLTRDELTWLRLRSQHVAASGGGSAAEVVAHLGAMQAQDYAGSLWSVGARLPHSTESTIEQAIASAQIIRTWPMRGTLHLVAAKDVRWMLALTALRATAAAASRRLNLEIDDAVLAKTRRIIEPALEGGRHGTRKELCALLDQNNIPTAGQRGIHLLHHLSEEGLLCLGPRAGKEPTFVLLDEWVPREFDAPQMSREAAVAELVRRYFVSHGPATERDFAGWAGLTLGDTRAGLAANTITLISDTFEDKTYWLSRELAETRPQPLPKQTAFLLAGFDEYMLGYKDRSPALAFEHSQRIVPGNNGMFLATMVLGGQVVGTWKRTAKKAGLGILLIPFATLSAQDVSLFQAAAAQYAAFLGQPLLGVKIAV